MNETFQRVAGQRVHYRASDGLLNGLLVGNFKAFGHLQRVPLRPLTLLYGANSTGKSSLLHALLLGKHAFENGQLDVLETNPLAGAVDLGGFRQFVHGNDSRLEVTLGWQIPSPNSGGEFRAGVPKLTFLDTKLVPCLEVECGFGMSDTRGREQDGIELRRYSVRAGGEDFLSFRSFGYPVDKTTQNRTRAFVSTQDRRDTLMVLDGINWSHPALQNWLTTEVAATSGAQLMPGDWQWFAENTEDFGADTWVDAWAGCRREDLFPNQVDWARFLGEDAYEGLRRNRRRLPRSGTARREALFKLVDVLLARLADEILRKTHVQLESIFERMRYLRAFRRLPSRELGAPEEMDPLWLSSGGGAWAVVSEDESVRAAVNQWLGGESLLSSDYELVVERFAEVEALASGFTKASRQRSSGKTADTVRFLQHAARKLAVSQPGSVQSRLRLKDRRTGAMVSLRDVGVGISQVLPVLVAAYGTEGQMHLMEQPEIHLHPRLQAELADVFIESALGSRRNAFFLETHSEHLLLRIMRRVPKGRTPVRPDDVAILFVEPGPRGSVVRELPLNERGELVKPWPGGFFEEGLREMLA
jgi:predicted ATPase